MALVGHASACRSSHLFHQRLLYWCEFMIRKAANIPLRQAEPAWEIARLFPAQGNWSEQDYLSLTHDTNWLVEFSDGSIEVLPMPKTSHQLIVQFLNNLLFA